jgi:hypothetical protein
MGSEVEETTREDFWREFVGSTGEIHCRTEPEHQVRGGPFGGLKLECCKEMA